MSDFTFSVVPLPMVIMAITAATPMTMPSRVRNERSTLRPTERSASLMVSQSIRRPPAPGLSEATWPSRKPTVRSA